MIIFVGFNNDKMLLKEVVILSVCSYLKNMNIYIVLKNLHMVLYYNILLFGQ